MFRIYERVSSKGQNLDAQHPELVAFGKAKEAEGGKVKFYPADKFTGKTMNRPSFQTILKDLRKGDVLVVWRLDRLGRTARGLVNLIGDLKDKGVAFVSLRDGLDTSKESATQNLLLNVLISVAQFETEVRSERISAAIEAKKERGEEWKGGRPKGSCHKLTDEVRATVLKLKAEGKSVSAISRILKLARNTVYAALRETEAVA